MQRGFPNVIARLATGMLAFVLAAPVYADDGSVAPGGATVSAPAMSPAEAGHARLIALIQEWVAAVNREDRAAVLRPWSAANTIVDSLPPFIWQGPDAVGGWWADFQSIKTAQGLTDVAFSFEPRHIDVVDERAYVVGDAWVDYTLGSGRSRDRATWTFCLERDAGAWRFTAWAWGHLERGPAPRSP